MVYADNAATTRLDEDAFEAMKPLLLDFYSNASQPYSFSRKVKAALRDSREVIANCINANPEEIFFTSGGTESDNWAIRSIALQNNFCGNIVTSEIEHHAILNACFDIQKMGIDVITLPVSNKGIVDIKELESRISDGTKLVSIMLANNEIGTIQPIAELADIAHQKNVLFHTDAVQAIGHINVNVKNLQVDMLSASGHKFNAPKGIGFFYVKNGTKLSSYLSGGAQERNMRAGTENIASIVAMACALKKNCDEMKSTAENLRKLEDLLIKGLFNLNVEYKINGSEYKLPGNISLSLKGYDGEALLHRLDLMGICVSTGSACDSQNQQISHVLKAIHLAEEYARGTIRISLGRDNTKEDIKKIISALIKITKG